jgi:hypothetical protein
MYSMLQRETDPMEGTVEHMEPTVLATKANSEDNPTWDQAMNGPDRSGYWQACETELDTLQNKKDAWDVVDR